MEIAVFGTKGHRAMFGTLCSNVSTSVFFPRDNQRDNQRDLKGSRQWLRPCMVTVAPAGHRVTMKGCAMLPFQCICDQCGGNACRQCAQG